MFGLIRVDADDSLIVKKQIAAGDRTYPVVALWIAFRRGETGENPFFEPVLPPLSPRLKTSFG